MTAARSPCRQTTPPSGRRIPAGVFDAARAVHEATARAEARARSILEAAEASATRVLEDARQEGYREGLARAGAALAAAAAERDRLLAAVEEDVVAIALDIARKIIGWHASSFPQALAELAAAALREVRACHEVAIRAHPEDVASLRSAESELAACLLRAPLRLREDPSLARGSVVVETEAGRIDAGFEAQLSAFARALAEAAA